jgi:hypothetical protein
VNKVPVRVALQSIQDWCVVHFKDVTHDRAAPPHWFLTIPINPGALFLLCIITSQVEKRAYFYQKINPKAARSLVRIEARSFPFLPKESPINCNAAELLSIEELEKRVNQEKGLKIEGQQIPADLKKRIKAAIINSPLVSPAIKKHLNP